MQHVEIIETKTVHAIARLRHLRHLAHDDVGQHLHVGVLAVPADDLAQFAQRAVREGQHQPPRAVDDRAGQADAIAPILAGVTSLAGLALFASRSHFASRARIAFLARGAVLTIDAVTQRWQGL
jgi:hypothetical protein